MTIFSSPIDSINFSETLVQLADRSVRIFAFLDIAWLLLHAQSHFVGCRGARIRRILLVQFPVERMLVLDDEVLEDPHVALVEETIDGY